jgi:elongator complex protein 2
VNAVKFLRPACLPGLFLLSGSADKVLRVWKNKDDTFEVIRIITDHESSVNSIAALGESDIFISGAADATVKIWQIKASASQEPLVQLIQSLSLHPIFFPLALDVAKLDDSSLILSVAGTKSFVQIYVSEAGQFTLAATLTGHDGWIRSLSFIRETPDQQSDLILASASQDKYIRLWRVHQGGDLPTANAASDPALGSTGKFLSNKAHRFQTSSAKYSITFEALLLGHEDWIYSTSWSWRGRNLQLLSASADNSLAIWQSDSASGVWVCTTRLGEISSQKGATTATGSTGGFWIGLWSPSGDAVVSLGRTGGWRLWERTNSETEWNQAIAVSGHVREVRGICWAPDSSYLLSTGSDQTTRLFAEWKVGNGRSWHEFSRPQIHGYDLNCIGCITPSEFVSGADEKLLRVFNEPAAVATMLEKLCGINPTSDSLPDAANIPVLGLSNKAIQTVGDDETAEEMIEDQQDAADRTLVTHKSTLNLSHPPFEDHLSRDLLWPEREKLYGHGYEISALATSHDGKLIATACKASSVEHAVIRIYETQEWREVKPALTAHSLTVTGLEFSHDDKYLLSVGRDRQWTVFERDSTNLSAFTSFASNPKGHSRMILDGSWAPKHAGEVFSTAGRDKNVKIWRADGKVIECKATIATSASVTAVAFCPAGLGDKLALVYGREDGTVLISTIDTKSLAILAAIALPSGLTPTKPVNGLAWRAPSQTHVSMEELPDAALQLALASEDSSVRVYSLSRLPYV